MEERKESMGISSALARPEETGPIPNLFRDSRDVVYEKQPNGSMKRIGVLVNGQIQPHVKMRKKDRKAIRRQIKAEVIEVLKERTDDKPH